jgi:glyoxylase-like metal-dependent hydrolase (beta-lactamase superfamily II)
VQEIDLPYISLFINTGRERVLVDTGIGVDGMGPAPGKLLPLLRAEGTQPHEIGTVILSHGHPDHIGGSLNEDGKPAFPNCASSQFCLALKSTTSEGSRQSGLL